jgi:hypothetical protein
LASLLDTTVDVAPILTTASTVTGRVKSGFTLPLGSGVILYGIIEKSDIPVLAAYMCSGADDSKLTQAFVKLNKSDGLLLVDWVSQIVLIGTSGDDNIQVWQP